MLFSIRRRHGPVLVRTRWTSWTCFETNPYDPMRRVDKMRSLIDAFRQEMPDSFAMANKGLYGRGYNLPSTAGG